MKKLNEFELIEKYFAPLAGEGSFDLKDDAALILPSDDHTLVITQDAVAENIHFFPDDSPDLIAKKALRVNLSDLAAKGAVPKSISLALGLGQICDEAWLDGFAKGLAQDCEAYGLSINGGDTFATGAGVVISITAIGEIPTGRYVSRLGANDGDQIYVTGTIGDGALGLLERKGLFNAPFLRERYLLPQPRLEFVELVMQYASASMDISDGLVGDLEKICVASNVGAEIIAADIPLSEASKAIIQSESNYLKQALTDGDDYELLLCIPKENEVEFLEATSVLKTPVTRIGKLISGEGVKVFDKHGKPLEFKNTSYMHGGE